MQTDELIAQLKCYAGRTPRPADFDEYWQRALSELAQVRPQVELRRAAFQAPFADCYEMYFTGVRQARIHARLLRPKRKPQHPGPGLVMFHGYSGNCGEFSDKLQYVAAGFTVAAMDARGQGGLSQDTGGHTGPTWHGQLIRGLENASPDDLLFRQIFLDCAELVKLITALPDVNPARIGVTGISQGGGLALAAAALVPEVKQAVVAFPFLCDYRKAWEMELPTVAYSELRDFFRWFDPRHEREQEIFTRLGYIDVQNLAPRIKAKVLMATGLSDNICPPQTQFAAYNKIKSPKSVKFYPDFGHELLPEYTDMTYLEMLTL